MSVPTCRAVVFDMDGLMLDTEPVYKVAWQRAARDCGREIDDSLYFELIGRTNRDVGYAVTIDISQARNGFSESFIGLNGHQATRD